MMTTEATVRDFGLRSGAALISAKVPLLEPSSRVLRAIVGWPNCRVTLVERNGHFF
jgi:hypothetical protein